MATPTEITANTTVEFSITPATRVPSDGYTYIFRLGGASVVSKNGAIDGEDVNFKLAPADTATHATGLYFYQIFANKNSDVYVIESGRISVNASIGATGEFDGRTVAERIVDAIDALIEGRATSDQQSYVIASGAGSRSLSRIPVLELKQLRKEYAAIAVAERRARNGEGIFKNHRITFTCD